jgi:hypothetical protein
MPSGATARRRCPLKSAEPGARVATSASVEAEPGFDRPRRMQRGGVPTSRGAERQAGVGSTAVFERFTDPARQAVVGTQGEAR